MGLARAIGTGLGRSGDFSGRANRAEFWWFSLFQVVVMTGLIAVDLRRIAGIDADAAYLLNLPFVWYATTWGWLALALPSWAVAVRRLHDTDRSGLWYLLYLVPFGALVLLVFLVLPGTPGRNRFGGPSAPMRRTMAQTVPVQPVLTAEAQQARLRALRQGRMQGPA